MNGNHDVPEAFDIGRGFSHGFASLQRSLLPMLIGGLIMSCTEGGGGGGGNSFGGGGDGEGLEQIINDLSGEGGGASYDVGPGLNDAVGGLIDAGASLPFSIPFTVPLQGYSPFESIGGLGVGVIVAIVAVVLLVMVAFFALRCWVHPGYIRVQNATLVGGEGTFGDLFSGGDKFMSIAGWKILKALIGMGVFIVSALPGGILLGLAFMDGGDPNVAFLAGGIVLMLLIAVPGSIYVSLGLTMGELAITLEGVGAMGALDRSWSLAKGRRVGLFVFFLVFGIANIIAAIVGICLLCVGWFITVPAMRSIYETAFTEGFMLITQGREASQSWAVWSFSDGA